MIHFEFPEYKFMTKYFFLLLLTITMVNCRNSKEEIIKSKDKIDFNYWNWIEISPENQRISIYYESDTARLVTWDWKDTIMKGYDNVRIKCNFTTEKFLINKQERDSVFKYTFEIIQDTTRPKWFCTEYCGHVSFSIESRQVVRSSSFNSICHWTEISEETKKIYSILSTKIKIQTSSDCLE